MVTGIALDQLLLTRQAHFTPVGRIAGRAQGEGVRRFADDFSRSPGHGLEAWNLRSGKWAIAFSFDPNRIPNQYALTGEAADAEAVVTAGGPPWRACAVEAALRPTASGVCGLLLEDTGEGAPLRVTLSLGEGGAACHVIGSGLDETKPLGDALRADQWHRLRVERQWRRVRVLLDGAAVLDAKADPARKGAVGLVVAKGAAVFDDVAVRALPIQGEWTRDMPAFRIGPYHFTNSRGPDPGDYMDFTPAEWEAMRTSPDFDKLRRRPKMMALVGDEKSPWRRHGGRWQVNAGVLTGWGPAAVLQHWQDVISPLELRLRLKGLQPDSAAEVEVYATPEPGAAVRVSKALADGAWHRLWIRTDGRSITSRLDDGEWREGAFTRGDGGSVLLRVTAGQVAFDDVELTVPRERADSAFCAFDRREALWWRTGNWVDHAGIACALASNWVSLIVPESAGMLWTKRPVNPKQVWVAFNVEENSEWYGWHAHPSHVHFPFDNIHAALATTPGGTEGYRLEVNAQNHTATTLYRHGKAVATRRQDRDFPMAYRGGHAPFNPRRNRIVLVKRGGLLRAIINGREVLRYEDPQPLDTPFAGIGGEKTRINFSHVEVVDIPKSDGP